MSPTKKLIITLIITLVAMNLVSWVRPDTPTQAAEQCQTYQDCLRDPTLIGCGHASAGNPICQPGGLGTVGANTGGVWYDQTPDQFHDRVFNSPDNEIFGERYTYAQVNWIINSFVTMFSMRTQSATDLINTIRDLMKQTSIPSLKDYAQLGLPGLLVGMSTYTYSFPPASGIEYLSQSLASLKIVPSAYAQSPQGYGFGALNGVQILWKASRNMAYFLIVILLIAAGFAIMFRVKINPQTVVSLQTMIPKLVITLLLVTFSYAIAGLVIDLIYVVITLIVSMFHLTGVFQGDLGTAISWFTRGGFSRVTWFFIFPWLVVLLVGGLLILVLGSLSTLGAALIPGAAIAIIALIALIFFLWTLIKVWWMLVKTYITLVFLIIIGPWQMMLDLIPGQNGFGSWLRNMVAQASVFVVVAVMLLVNMVIWKPYLGQNWIGDAVGFFNSDLNPIGSTATGGANFDLPFVGGSGVLFNFILGYAVLAMIPKAADMVRDALKVPAFKYGTAFGEAISPISKPLGGTLSGMGTNISRGAKGPVGYVIGGTLQGVGGALSRP